MVGTEQAHSGSPKSKLSRIYGIASFAVLCSIVAFISYMVYEGSANGTAELCGNAFGQLIVWSIILFFFRKKLDVNQRLAIACLATSAYILFDKRQDIQVAFDTKEARGVMANAKGVDPVQLSSQHPNNRLLRAIADANKASLASQERLQALDTGAEPSTLGEDFGSDAPRSKLIVYRDAARTAASNSRSARAAIDGIFREEADRLRTQLREYMPNGMVSSTLEGQRKRHLRDSLLLQRYWDARIEFYDVIEKRVAHLVDNFGQYTTEKSGKITYAANEAAARHNALLKEQAAAIEKIESAQNAVTQAQMYYKEGWERLTSGGGG
ncbi:hypothetical protein [Methylorubrum thiocyanatum]|uniref:hypothetical protein n=1 Tax=Methylorubrum thiocyanatum TaxID=47958 RepID=UPI003F817125